MSKNKKEEDLEKLAKEELLREAKRGAERSQTMGTQGWLKPKLPTTNKRFLLRTLKSASIDVRQTKRICNTDPAKAKSSDESGASSSQSSASTDIREKRSKESAKPGHDDSKINDHTVKKRKEK